MSRPKWTRAIQEFITDTVLDDDYEYPMDGSDDELHDRIETAVNEVLCDTYGHEIIDDMCMKPEHRYCVHCKRLATNLGAPA